MRARLLPLLMALAAGGIGCGQPLAPDSPGARPESPDPRADPASETKNGRPKVDTALQELIDRPAREHRPMAEIAEQLGFVVQGDKVQVQIRTAPTGQKAAQAAIVAVGGVATGATSDGALVQGWVPVTAIDALAAYPDVLFIERPHYARPL